MFLMYACGGSAEESMKDSAASNDADSIAASVMQAKLADSVMNAELADAARRIAEEQAMMDSIKMTSSKNIASLNSKKSNSCMMN